MSNGTLPQYIAYTRTEDASQVTIICTDLTLTQALMPVGKPLTVYADTLTISDALSLPGQNVTIFARQLISNDGSLDLSGGSPSTSYTAGARAADGSAGQPFTKPAAGGTAAAQGNSGTNGTAGLPGSKGNDAGNLVLTVESVIGAFAFTANGGTGGRGQDGGNGGAGGDGQIGADAVIKYSDGNGYIADDPTAGGLGGTGGQGGTAGQSGDGGNGGNVSMTFVIPNSQPVEVSLNAGSAGLAAAPGGGGTPGNTVSASDAQPALGGREGYCYKTHNGGQSYTFCELTNTRTTSGGVGTSLGSGASATPANIGSYGIASSTQVDYPGLAAAQTVPIAQLQLVFQQAQLSYLNADYPTASTLLTWLANILPASADQSEQTQLGAVARTLLAYMAQGLDYYGLPRNNVPLANLAFYQAELSTLLAEGATIETAYNTYLQDTADQQAQLAQLQSALQQDQQTIARLQVYQDELLGSTPTTAPGLITQAQDAIAQLSQAQSGQQQVMLLSAEAFQDAVSQQANKCSFGDIMKALTSVLLVGIDAYNGISAISSVVSELGQAAAKTENIIKQIETVAKTVDDMQTKWNQIAELNSDATPDAGKLVMAGSDFDTAIQPFLSLPAAQDYQMQVHDYLGIVQARNQKVYEYNSLLVTQNNLASQIAQKQAAVVRIQNLMASANDPTLPECRAYMQAVYNDLQTHLLRYLYEQNQAYNYWALADNPFQVAGLTIADLDAINTQISEAITDKMNTTTVKAQPFQNIGVTISAVDRADQFAGFRQVATNAQNEPAYLLSFSITPDEPAFSNMAQVLASSFTISLPNATTTSGVIDIDLIHSGRAQLLDQQGSPWEFSHLSTLADYHIGQQAGGDLSGGDQYIGLSPFTAWTLQLLANNNPGLDLSQVSEVTISFSGYYYPMT